MNIYEVIRLVKYMDFEGGKLKFFRDEYDVYLRKIMEMEERKIENVEKKEGLCFEEMKAFGKDGLFGKRFV